MKKIFFIALLAILICLPANAYTVEGKVTYTVESARKLAFKDVPKTIPISLIEGRMQDADRQENLEALKSGSQLDNRNVQLFRGFIVKAYAVTYYDNPKYTYYYIKSFNHLAFTDINEEAEKETMTFPFRTFRYDIGGKLLAVGIYVSQEERYLYKNDGKLISHWIGAQGYNAKGRKIGTVEEISF